VKDPEEGLSASAKSYRAAAPWLAVVWQFTGSTLFGGAVGYAVDAHWKSQPWGMVVGLLVGGGVGFYALVRSTTKLLEAQKKTKP
jgi:ATP synthase protein I